MGSTTRHLFDAGFEGLDQMTLLLLALGCLLLVLGRRSMVFTALGIFVLLDLPWGMSLTKRSGVLDPLLVAAGRSDL